MLKSRSIILTITLIFFTALANAQSGKDSVYFFNQQQKLIDNILFSPTFSTTNNLKNYGVLQLDYKREVGGLRRAQEAYTINIPRFLAKGFNVLGKFRLAGSLEFNNSNEDSLANGQKNNLEDFTTYYPYANKSGHYRRQNYIIKTSFSYAALNNHLLPFINLDYQKHQSSGTVDPRVSSNRFIVKLKPGVSLNIKKNTIGLYGLFGKADEQVRLSYKNIVYKNSLLFKDRIHYMQYGYGSSVIKDSSSVYKYDNYSGLGLQYVFKEKDWNIQFLTEYQLFENKNYDKTRTTNGFTTIGLFNLNTITSSLFINKTQTNSYQQLALDAVYDEGYDANLKISGSLNRVSYRVNSLKFNVSYSYLWDKNENNVKEIGFNLNYNQNDKQDLAQADGLAYEQMKISLNSTFYHLVDDKSRFKISLSPYIFMPINTVLKYNPNSMTEFIRNVVFTDYYYFDSKALGTEIYGEYTSSKLIKNQQFGFYFKIDYRKQLNQELRNDLNPTFVPNGSRSIFNIGVNMYL